jgi:hypothetical protein
MDLSLAPTMKGIVTPILHQKRGFEMKPRYTVQRCTLKENNFYGPVHASLDSNETLCGQHVDEKWWIHTNDFTGVVTCKKCKRIIRNINISMIGILR